MERGAIYSKRDGSVYIYLGKANVTVDMMGMSSCNFQKTGHVEWCLGFYNDRGKWTGYCDGYKEPCEMFNESSRYGTAIASMVRSQIRFGAFMCENDCPIPDVTVKSGAPKTTKDTNVFGIISPKEFDEPIELSGYSERNALTIGNVRVRIEWA